MSKDRASSLRTCFRLQHEVSSSGNFLGLGYFIATEPSYFPFLFRDEPVVDFKILASLIFAVLSLLVRDFLAFMLLTDEPIPENIRTEDFGRKFTQGISCERMGTILENNNYYL